MSPHNKKSPIIIATIFLMITCFLFRLLYKEINNNNKIAEDTQTKWQTEANQRQEISSLDASLKNINTEKIQLESHFAQGSDIVPFLNNIEQLGTQARVAAQVSSVDTLKGNTGLLLSIKASGNFESVYRFIRLLENSPYELEFMSVDIGKDASDVPVTDTTKNPSAGWTAILKVKLLSFVQ
jgi:uncharacterized membrane-anchored protein YhcB (DUF1043 family)